MTWIHMEVTIALMPKQLQNLFEKLHITEKDGQQQAKVANLDSASGQK